MKRIVWLVVLLVFLADYFIKTYLRLNLAFESIPVIPGFFNITVVFNTGAAFGILRDKSLLLLFLGIIFIAVFGFFILKEKKIRISECIFYGMIFGGALSNMWDRLVLGYVVDYLDLRYAGNNIWPVFNLSDSCISVGVILLVLAQFRGKSQKQIPIR